MARVEWTTQPSPAMLEARGSMVVASYSTEGARCRGFGSRRRSHPLLLNGDDGGGPDMTTKRPCNGVIDCTLSIPISRKGRREAEQVVLVSDFAVPLLETTMVVLLLTCSHAINIVLPQLVLDIFHMASTFVSSISTSTRSFNDLSEEEPYVTMLENLIQRFQLTLVPQLDSKNIKGLIL